MSKFLSINNALLKRKDFLSHGLMDLSNMMILTFILIHQIRQVVIVSKILI